MILVADQPVALELVGDALDALASQAPGPGDLRDAHRRRLHGGEHAPARAGLAGRAGERVADGRERAVEPEGEHDETAQRLARRRARPIDSILSI